MIPAEAVEAAKKVAFERYGSRPDTAYLRTILSVAAPHMLAEAWDRGHHDGAVDQMLHMENDGAKTTPNPYRLTE